MSKRKLEMQKRGEEDPFYSFSLNSLVLPLGRSLRLSEAQIPCIGGEKRIHRRRVCFHPFVFFMMVSNGAVAEPRRATFLEARGNRSNFQKIHIPADMGKLLSPKVAPMF